MQVVQLEIFPFSLYTAYTYYTYNLCSRNQWRRIFTLALFVEHILLDIEAEDERLKPLVMECTRNLGKVRIHTAFISAEHTHTQRNIFLLISQVIVSKPYSIAVLYIYNCKIWFKLKSFSVCSSWTNRSVVKLPDWLKHIWWCIDTYSLIMLNP